MRRPLAAVCCLLAALCLALSCACLELNADVTVAEAVAQTARLRASFTGETVPKGRRRDPWYVRYVTYATDHGMIARAFDDPERPVTCAEAASLLARALPQDAYAAANDVSVLPDVAVSSPYHDDLLRLVRAGVVAYEDDYGRVFPERTLKRAQWEAVLLRAAVPDRRVENAVAWVTSDEDACVLAVNSTYTNDKEGIASGWALDNRGGAARASLTEPYGALLDVSDEAGTALIRYLNKTGAGRVTLDTSVTTPSTGGVFLEFRNEADESVFRLELTSGAWCVRGENGMTEVYRVPRDETFFRFHIELDLDNDCAETSVNGADSVLTRTQTTGEDTNIASFRFATAESGRPVVVPGAVRMTANFAVYEGFDFADNGALPFGFSGENASIAAQTLLVGENGRADAAFRPLSGKTVCEFMLLADEMQETAVTLLCDGHAAAVFSSAGGGFSVNGTTVYDAFVQNLWYRLRLEADTESDTLSFKVNGRYVASDIPFLAECSSFDTLTFENRSPDAVRFDDVKVFRVVEHDDYVPRPAVPAGTDTYTVGVNACPLWSNGNHYGWSCISPYPDFRPVLGYYDEGSPETADWEIKYMVEHGIDFQALCVYFGSSPQRLAADHLFNGYQNAKYADMLKYCVIWEALSQTPTSLDDFDENYLPYFIEYFFKDPRYMVIENKPLVCVFAPDKIAERIGGNENAKAMFDAMREAVKPLGFDGVIFLACGMSNSTLKAQGFDGAYAYSWGEEGYSLATNKSRNLTSARDGSVAAVPTISVGYNILPWDGTRYPMMSVSDYASAHAWVKNTFLPLYARRTWQRNFVMLSTWNEYGEGTYIMPTADSRGFGYLDEVRKAYTSETDCASVDTVPTASQAYRINHRYPQHLHLLRPQGYAAAQSGSWIVNGVTRTLRHSLRRSSGGTLLLPFDPVSGADFLLALFHTWDDENKVLTLSNKTHTAVFTVGSAVCTVDGTRQTLPEAVGTLDGLPLLPIEALCGYMDYAFAVDANGNACVDTFERARYDAIASRTPYRWEFDTVGDTEGWTSSFFGLLTYDGALHAVAQTESTDPTMFAPSGLSLDTAAYTTLKYRIRYAYDPQKQHPGSYKQSLTMYFITEDDPTWSEDKTIKIDLSDSDSGSRFVVYTADLTAVSKWSGTVTALRFDPFNAVGNVDIDYIRFS